MYTKIRPGAAAPLANVGEFASSVYWSSSVDGDGYAWYQSFDGGLQYDSNSMNYTLTVRAVRVFEPFSYFFTAKRAFFWNG